MKSILYILLPFFISSLLYAQSAREIAHEKVLKENRKRANAYMDAMPGSYLRVVQEDFERAKIDRSGSGKNISPLTINPMGQLYASKGRNEWNSWQWKRTFIHNRKAYWDKCREEEKTIFWRKAVFIPLYAYHGVWNLSEYYHFKRTGYLYFTIGKHSFWQDSQKTVMFFYWLFFPPLFFICVLQFIFYMLCWIAPLYAIGIRE